MKILTSFLLLILLFSCNIIKPKNLEFYCKINGKTFLPDKVSSQSPVLGSEPLKAKFYRDLAVFSIIANKVPNSLSILIRLKYNETIQVKKYTLTNDVNGTNGFYILNYQSQSPEMLISQQGYFEVTKVEGNNIWGKFEFTCKSNQTNTNFKITNGEFNNLSYEI